MAGTLNQDQLNAIAKQSGYQGGSFSSAGLTNTPQVSNQSLGLNPSVQTPIGQTNPMGESAPITTTQPSPTTVNPSPYTGTSVVDALNQGGQASDFNSRTKLAQTYGIQGYTGSADQNTQLLQKYQQGLTIAKASNTEAPKTSGDGSKMVTDITGGPTQTPDINPVDTILLQDKAHQQYLNDYKKYTDTVSQQTSLLDEYKKMQTDANLPELNKERLNMKNIINGTEDDIRNEITKAGGFATESQVLGLAGARNKTLIKNYNNLTDTINNATQNINTMMGFSQTDKQNAINNLKEQLNFDQQEIQYADKMTTNAKSAYDKIISTPGYGYKALYASTGGDAHATSLIEKTLGLQQGQLAQLAKGDNTSGNTHVQLSDGRDVMIDKAGNIVKTIGGATPKGAKLLSVSEAQALGVPYGTTEAEAQSQGITPGAVNGVDEKTMGKIQSSPEYKTINGVLPALSTLVAYKDAITKNGTVEYLSGQGKGELQGTYGNALSAWKSLAGLGALSGADFSLAENAVPAPGLFTRSSTSQSKIQSSIDNAVAQAEVLTKRLIQNYPKATENLNTQLLDTLKTAYPTKNYVLSPDGKEVIEITK